MRDWRYWLSDEGVEEENEVEQYEVQTVQITEDIMRWDMCLIFFGELERMLKVRSGVLWGEWKRGHMTINKRWKDKSETCERGNLGL